MKICKTTVINPKKNKNTSNFKEGLTLPYFCKREKLIPLKVNGDLRGNLIAIEENHHLPFSLKRVYYIFNTKEGVSRGFHAHRNLQQLAICVAGKCRIVLDNGHTKEEVWLDSPTKGLLIKNMIWREMHDFSEDCVLVVLASEKYDEDDYIRDYEQFINEVLEKNLR